MKNKKLTLLYLLALILFISLITRIIITNDWINISILAALMIISCVIGYIEEQKECMECLTEDDLLNRQFVWFNPKSKKIQLDSPSKWSQNETPLDK